MASGKEDESIDVAGAGRAIYAEMRERLEAAEKGNFVVIDAYSGDYEVDPNPTVAARRLEKRCPRANMYERLIGRPEAYRMVSVRIPPDSQ